MQLLAKLEHQEPGRGKRGPTQSLRAWPADTGISGFGPPGLRQEIAVVASRTRCGHLLQQPSETHTVQCVCLTVTLT